MSTFNVIEYQNFLKQKFSTDFDEFNRLLIETEGVIAGGSVTRIYSGLRYGTDIDIYVHPSDDVINLAKFLNRFGYVLEYGNSYVVPGYDSSFLLKNNILGRFHYVKYDTYSMSSTIDIMIVSPNMRIRDVVTNFDLSFCEIWYDGNSIYAQYPNDVINKSGILKPSYISSFLKLNSFTLKRIKKYRNRGFKISIKIPDEICEENQSFNILEKEKNNVTDSVKWFVLFIYNILILDDIPDSADNFAKLYGIEKICKYPLINFTVHDLNVLVNKVIDDADNNNDFIKENYISILVSTDYHHLPKKYKDIIEQITGITEEDIPKVEEEDNVEEDNNFIEYEDDDNRQENQQLSIIENENLEDIEINENTLGNTCTDLLMMSEENITEYLQNEDTVLLISRNSNNTFDILCFEREMLQNIYNDRDDSWFYECNGPFITNNGVPTQDRQIFNYALNRPNIVNRPYLKIPIDATGLNGFISAGQIKNVLENNYRALYLEQKLNEEGIQDMITHTISYKNVYGNNPNWVSANHCQAGSSILIYTLKVCRNPESCIRSILYNPDNEDELENDLAVEINSEPEDDLESLSPIEPRRLFENSDLESYPIRRASETEEQYNSRNRDYWVDRASRYDSDEEFLRNLSLR